MKDRGSALLTAVIAVAVLTLVAGTFYTLSASRARMESSEEKGLRAYYLAEAGIQFGVAHAYLLQHVPEDPMSLADPFGEDYGGEIRIEWLSEDQTVTIRSTGIYREVERILEAKFSIPETPET